jgi:hypothetical protein
MFAKRDERDFPEKPSVRTESVVSRSRVDEDVHGNLLLAYGNVRVYGNLRRTTAVRRELAGNAVVCAHV